MNKNPIAAPIFATLLAGVSLAAEGRQSATPATTNLAAACAAPQTASATRLASTPGLTWLTDLQKAQAKAEEAGSAATNSVAFKNLSVEEFAQMAADKQNVILDVRTATEFKAGHLPGAVNLDVNAADFQAKAALLDKSKTYLVHCASGVRSVKACENLSRLDFPKLYNLLGGFKAWAQAGKPVEK